MTEIMRADSLTEFVLVIVGVLILVYVVGQTQRYLVRFRTGESVKLAVSANPPTSVDFELDLEKLRQEYLVARRLILDSSKLEQALDRVRFKWVDGKHYSGPVNGDIVQCIVTIGTSMVGFGLKAYDILYAWNFRATDTAPIGSIKCGSGGRVTGDGFHANTDTGEIQFEGCPVLVPGCFVVIQMFPDWREAIIQVIGTDSSDKDIMNKIRRYKGCTIEDGGLKILSERFPPSHLKLNPPHPMPADPHPIEHLRAVVVMKKCWEKGGEVDKRSEGVNLAKVA